MQISCFCSTIKPGISELFQKHKKFTIARCLLSKGSVQMSNIGFISVLDCPRFEIKSPVTIQGHLYWFGLVMQIFTYVNFSFLKIILVKEHFLTNMTFWCFFQLLNHLFVYQCQFLPMSIPRLLKITSLKEHFFTNMAFEWVFTLWILYLFTNANFYVSGFHDI